jgi:hypothetical protein
VVENKESKSVVPEVPVTSKAEQKHEAKQTHEPEQTPVENEPEADKGAARDAFFQARTFLSTFMNLKPREIVKYLAEDMGLLSEEEAWKMTRLELLNLVINSISQEQGSRELAAGEPKVQGGNQGLSNLEGAEENVKANEEVEASDISRDDPTLEEAAAIEVPPELLMYNTSFLLLKPFRFFSKPERAYDLDVLLNLTDEEFQLILKEVGNPIGYRDQRLVHQLKDFYRDNQLTDLLGSLDLPEDEMEGTPGENQLFGEVLDIDALRKQMHADGAMELPYEEQNPDMLIYRALVAMAGDAAKRFATLSIYGIGFDSPGSGGVRQPKPAGREPGEVSEGEDEDDVADENFRILSLTHDHDKGHMLCELWVEMDKVIEQPTRFSQSGSSSMNDQVRLIFKLVYTMVPNVSKVMLLPNY